MPADASAVIEYRMVDLRDDWLLVHPIVAESTEHVGTGIGQDGFEAVVTAGPLVLLADTHALPRSAYRVVHAGPRATVRPGRCVVFAPRPGPTTLRPVNRCAAKEEPAYNCELARHDGVTYIAIRERDVLGELVDD